MWRQGFQSNLLRAWSPLRPIRSYPIWRPTIIIRHSLLVACHEARSAVVVGVLVPPRTAKRGLGPHFNGTRGLCPATMRQIQRPTFRIPFGCTGLIMNSVRHSFSLGFRSPSGFIAGSRFGGSFFQSQCPSGLTPRSSGPDCVGPLNFFR